MAGRVEEPIRIGGCRLPNRLYRAPLLECAGTGPDAVDILLEELEPAAAAGAGLIFQGATIVRETGGCAAPNMTRVHDPVFLDSCRRLTQRIEDHGSRIFLQLAHGGLRSLETWHVDYRRANPDLEQLAVSPPPTILRLLERCGMLSFNEHVLSTAEVYELADDFGRAAAAAVDAGYHGIHIAGANMGIVEQFCSPLYNRRTDEFGCEDGYGVRFFEVLYNAIDSRIPHEVPIVTKIPAETVPAPVVGQRLTLQDGVDLARSVAEIGYDGVVPVTGTGFWDASLVRGAFPDRAWKDSQFQDGYRRAFGGPLRRHLVRWAQRLQSGALGRSPAWNESFCRRVSNAVSVPVFAEGGIRSRGTIERLLATGACDLVGLGRPFYAEPRLPARLLETNADERVICESCNNCVVPQVTGAPGRCRTPPVLKHRGELIQAGAYERASETEHTPRS